MIVVSLYPFIIFIAWACHQTSSLSIWVLRSFVFSIWISIILCSYNRIIQSQYSDEFLEVFLNKLNICEVTFPVSNYFVQSNLLNINNIIILLKLDMAIRKKLSSRIIMLICCLSFKIFTFAIGPS